MGNVADEATIIRQWLTNELSGLLGGVGGDRATETTLAAVLAELRLANQRWFGTDAVGNTYPTPLSPFFTGVSDVITGNAPPISGWELWLDVKRTGTLWQDSGRTIAANAGDPVGSWHDPTNGRAATAAGSSRPTRAASGLSFDAVNDALVVSNLPVHEWPEMTVVAATFTGDTVPGNQAAVGFDQPSVTRWALGPCAD